MALGTLIHRQPARRLVRRDFDRLMDDLWSGFGLAPLAPGAPRTVARNGSPGSPSGEGESEARYTPRLDAVELEDEYRVTAELPGVDAKDFDVTVEEIVGNSHGACVPVYDSAAAVNRVLPPRAKPLGVGDSNLVA